MATRRRASRSTLTGSITDLQRRVKYLQSKPVPSKLANQVVTRTAIQPRAVSTDQIALAAITNDQVAADAIRQEQLAELSVGNAELQNNAVLTRNISQDAVTAESIAINAVGSSEIADNAVGSGEIADNAVGSGEIADSAVGSSEIGMDAVGQSEISPGAVGTSELADGAVTSSKIGGSEVKTANIDNGAVTVDKLGPQAVTADKIQSNTITNLQIGPRAVDTGELADSAVTPLKLANNAVTTSKIANLNVTNAKIEQGTINIDKVNSAFSGLSASRGIRAGIGVNLSYNDNNNTLNIGALFGTGRNDVARGDHSHSYTTSYELSGANRHRHTGQTSPSTVKVKKEITSYSPENIKNLLKLEPKRYKYKRNKRNYQQTTNREWMHGYLVEELIDLGFPEPVGYSKDGEPEALDYGLMSMLVLELVKVQQTEIDFLKEEVSRLKDAK